MYVLNDIGFILPERAKVARAAKIEKARILIIGLL